MRYQVIALFLAMLLAGCAYNRFQDDIADNQYSRIPVHADANAVYVGEWTAATDVGVRSIKIRDDGRLKVCLASSSGTRDGKVYLENGVPALIMDTGARVRIIDMNRDFLVLDIYGKQEKYHAGLVDEACVTAFKNFE